MTEVPLIYLNTGWLVTVLRFIRERAFFRQLNRSEFEKHASRNTERVPFQNKIYVNRNGVQRHAPVWFHRVETRNQSAKPSAVHEGRCEGNTVEPDFELVCEILTDKLDYWIFFVNYKMVRFFSYLTDLNLFKSGLSKQS